MIYLDGEPRISSPAREAFQAALEDELRGATLVDALQRRALPIYELAGFKETDTLSPCSSGAEAINQVHWTAFVERARKEGKCHFVTTPNEDAPLLQSLKRLEELGCFVHIAPLDTHGRVDLVKLAELLTPRTAMLSLSAANALTGVVQPLNEIHRLTQSKGVWLHVEASCALGKMEAPIADYLTFDGAALHAGPGSGVALACAGLPLTPLTLGAPINVPAFMALSAACAHATLFLDTMGLEIARLRGLLEEGARVLFHDVLRLPNVTTLVFPGVHQEALLYALRRKGCATAIGGASAPHLHRQLIACGIDEKTALSSLSFSLSRFTSQRDIEQAVQFLAETTQALQPLAEDL